MNFHLRACWDAEFPTLRFYVCKRKRICYRRNRELLPPAARRLLERSKEALDKSEDVLKRVVERDGGDAERIRLTPVPNYSRGRQAVAELSTLARQADRKLCASL